MAKPRKIVPISKAELAARLNVSRQYINKQTHGPWLAICLDDGSVDFNHPIVQDRLNPRPIPKPVYVPPHPAPARPPKPDPIPVVSAPQDPPYSPQPPVIRRPPPPEPGPVEEDSVVPPDDGSPEAMDELGELPFRRVVEMHRTDHRFLKWLDGLKKMEDIRKTRLDNDETEGKVILREGVKIHIFGALESFTRRLLRDISKTLASRLMSAIKSGATLEECEALIRDAISSQLRIVKSTASRILREPHET